MAIHDHRRENPEFEKARNLRSSETKKSAQPRGETAGSQGIRITSQYDRYHKPLWHRWRVGPTRDMTITTVGVNWYWRENAKCQIQISHTD